MNREVSSTSSSKTYSTNRNEEKSEKDGELS